MPSLDMPVSCESDTSVQPDRFEVRPRAAINAILATIGCAGFTLAGIGIILSGAKVAVLAGLLSIFFFGVGGLYAIPRLARRRVAMVLTRAGIEQCYQEGSTFIPWGDVETIGVFKIASTKMVGVRLRTYERYLSSMSPELVKLSQRGLKFFKVTAGMTSVIDVLAGAELKGFAKVRNLSDALAWTRKNYGYDLAFGWPDRDRSAERFVALLEEYRRAA